MHLKSQNVNDAFRYLVERFNASYIEPELFIETDSRAGKVRQITEPVTVTYHKPLQRVLFNQARDANCFFHLFESLWMLAGRNDVAPLAYYSSGISDIASDNGKTFNGAYGYRWRKPEVRAYNEDHEYLVIDQLPIIIDQLKRKPESRRCVLQMWNVEDDLLKIDVTKDVCCNLSCTFQIQSGKLVMTVFNRSNDLIWGMLGANVVHFSFLQEYMAARIGVEVGPYHQITNNLHVYTDRFKPNEWLEDTKPDWYGVTKPCVPFPLVDNPKRFDDELYLFVEQVMAKKHGLDSLIFREPFFVNVAYPMARLYNCYKEKDWEGAKHWGTQIKADDWGLVSRLWVEKRYNRWLGQNPYNTQGVEE